jgi:hypothetical protein
VKARAAGCLLLAAAAGAACNIRDPRLSGAALPCSSSAQCPTDSVCFLGECRGASSRLSLVMAEVRAPADQQLGVVQRVGIDLRQSTLVDFQLQPLLHASGTVVRSVDGQPGATTPVPDAGVVLTDTPAISDRAASVVAQTDASGAFSLTFASSSSTLLVVPPAPAPPTRPPPTAPPLSSPVNIVLPAPGQLAHVSGTLVSGPSRLAGARVTAIDASGQPLSVATTTDSSGAFSLQLPPGPPSYFLQIGPDEAAPATDPAIPSFPLQGPFTGTVPAIGDLGALPAPATLAGTVLDVRQQPVAAARVLALSLDPTGWVISRQAVTDGSGAFSMTVRAGQYAVRAVPDIDPALPGVSDPIAVTLPAPALPIVCPDKSQGTGAVIRPDGQRVGAGHQITAMRLPDRLVAARMARATSTDAAGSFTIVGDRGHYRLEVLPPPATGLPRKIVSVELGAAGLVTQLPLLQLSPALAVVGTVGRTAGQTPVVGATLDFFALDASGTRSVLIGSALSDAQGRYQAVLPDVPTPTD